MTNYKIINIITTPEGKKYTIVAIAESYEKVVRKVIRDLESVWNKIVDLPYALQIEKTDETELGTKTYDEEGNEISEQKEIFDKWRIVPDH